ncbi:MAG: DinB family protein, partial [Bacteroidota bacterium]
LKTPYREGGWTGRQLIHHLADSHINAFIRCKLATTEDWPEILPYRQGEWASQIDHTLEIEFSLSILTGLHKRWSHLLSHLSTDDWTNRGYFHPEYGRKQPLFEVVALYSWHSRHHTGHLKLLA